MLALRRIIEEIQDSELGRLIVVFIDFCKAFDSVYWAWIRAILLHYNVPLSLVEAIMSIYYGARVKVRFDSEQFTDYIDLRLVYFKVIL